MMWILDVSFYIKRNSLRLLMVQQYKQFEESPWRVITPILHTTVCLQVLVNTTAYTKNGIKPFVAPKGSCL